MRENFTKDHVYMCKQDKLFSETATAPSSFLYSKSVLQLYAFCLDVPSSPHSTHHVDSQSLERLGVYVPRANVAGTFINPAGIIPPSKKYSKCITTASRNTPIFVGIVLCPHFFTLSFIPLPCGIV